MQKGSIIKFGKYEWVILDKYKDRILIITKDIIEQKSFHDRHEPINWKNSSLRNYLNNDFFMTFSLQDQLKIHPILNKNKANNWYESFDQDDTIDKIFILSLEEMAGKYFNDSLDLLHNRARNQRYWLEKKDKNNFLRRSTYQGYIWWYWVRTSGRVNTSAVYIHGDGNIGIQGNKASKKTFNTIHPITKSNEGGIRPALWLKIDS